MQANSKSSKQLEEEIHWLRCRNEDLETLLTECRRALNAGSDLKSLYEVAQDLIELKRAEEELKKERDYFENVLDNSADAIGIVDSRGRFLRWNKRAEELFGYSFEELKGKSAFDLYADRPELDRMLSELRRKGYVRDYEISIQRKDGRIVPFGMSISVLRDKGRTIGSVCVARDLTQIKQAQQALQKINEKLEQRVQERTRELTRANRKLEEANIALRVLLEKKDENKRTFEENMVFNVKQLIQPCLQELKNSRLSDRQRFYLDMIESQIEEVISPLNKTLAYSYGLTPTEMQLADLIRQGKVTKEIAESLNLSKRTVDTHRHNIRRKLGISNKSVNLRTFLLDMESGEEPRQASQSLSGK
jgi:PAS domain S-box-containing protein